MRIRQLLLPVLLALLVTGCAGARLQKLDATLRAYERAIRWFDYQTAFALANQPDAPVPDFQQLKNIRVTSYDRVDARPGDTEGRQLTQTVEIRYVNINSMSERVYNDVQKWVYVEAEERWRLTTPFPTFK